MISGRNRRATRRAAWLALFAILLQALLPAAHHPAGMAMAGAAGFDLSQNLCVAPGSTAPSAPGNAPLHHQPLCAICVAMHAVAGFIPPTAPSVAVRRDRGPVELALVLAALPRQALHSPQQPRAPPVPV